MIQPTKVKPLDGYRIWIEFEDGVKGEADLSRLAGRGIFKAWDDREVFESVRIDFPYRAIVWGDSDMLELCTDTFYLELTRTTWDELVAAYEEVQPVA